MTDYTSQEGYIPVTGGRVWYRIVGKGKGIPLLTLHGGPGANSFVLQVLTVLADERPVIFYDQLGGGKSDRPDNPELWVLDRFVEELATVRTSLGLKQFHLLAHSWGTMLAIEYALQQPVGLVSLVFSGPVMSAPRYFQDANILKRDLPVQIQKIIEQHEAAGTTESPEYQEAFAEWLRRHGSRNPQVLADITKAFQDPVMGINPQVYNTMQGPSEFSFTGNLKDFDRTVRLPEIKIPVLFTCGRYDECTPGATAWYQSLLPGSEMTVFENSAHTPMREEPELYFQTVRDFLHRVETHSA